MTQKTPRSWAFVLVGIVFMAVGFGQMNSGGTAFSAFVPVGIVFLVIGLRRRHRL